MRPDVQVPEPLLTPQQVADHRLIPTYSYPLTTSEACRHCHVSQRKCRSMNITAWIVAPGTSLVQCCANDPPGPIDLPSIWYALLVLGIFMQELEPRFVPTLLRAIHGTRTFED